MLGWLIFHLYRINRRSCRSVLLWLARKIDGGPFYSETMRRIFKKYYNVEVGKYTHGSCFIPGNFDRFTKIGRYCSIAAEVRVFNRNHPMEFKSTHAFFCNPLLKYTKEDLVDYIPLEIGNDVWLGHGAIILPSVTKIGDGAVVGAGCVVSKNIPPYAVAVGHPVRIVRYRFSQAKIKELLAEKWWEKEMDEIVPEIKQYQQRYEKPGDAASDKEG